MIHRPYLMRRTWGSPRARNRQEGQVMVLFSLSLLVLLLAELVRVDRQDVGSTLHHGGHVRG